MRLFLFDIDGTLVHVNGRGREAVNEALSSLTNRPISLKEVPFSGRTDPAIIEAVLAHNDLPTTDSMIEKVTSTYVETMRGALRPADVEVLPGVSPLLPHLHDQSDTHLGLVTGNVEPIAYEKLDAQGLADYFPVGAFGSDHAERNRLPAFATRRATDHAGHSFRPDEHTIIVGDTPHDIECARAAGARVVAVGTGNYDRDELSRHDPDLLLDTFPAPDAFLQRVLNL
jgi:phosphoglycolate phosphatase-like HAD superfamily hydrolase